jgi:signal transduction histidine kinase
MRISLRGRLALWYLLTIPALVFGLVFMAQQVMVVSLRGEMDNRLKDRAELTANALSSIFSGNPDSYNSAIEEFIKEQLPAIPLLLRVIDAEGEVLATFGDIPEPIVPYLNIPMASANINVNEGQFHTITVKGEETLRMYTVALETPSASEPLVLIQTGDSLSYITTAEDQLWRYGTGVGIGGAILILAVGFFILQRGFRPLDRILTRVQEIEHGSLHAGLPDEPRPPELQQLANSLNTMWQRLHEAFRAREALFASVSHDLRTPLTAMQGQIDVLLMKQLSPDLEVTGSLTRIAREVRRLVRMTDDLLLNAQLESNPELTHQAINLRELLEDVVVDVWALSEDLELDLPTSEDILTSGDYELIKQMVLNIVDNAIKYTSKGGKIKLSLGQANDWAVLEVSDSGIGIPAHDLPHVMEPFYRSKLSRKSATRGTGLGLAIVKRVVELYDGQIEIQSQEGVGTTVKVYLPLLGGETEPTRALERVETATIR